MRSGVGDVVQKFPPIRRGLASDDDANGELPGPNGLRTGSSRGFERSSRTRADSGRGSVSRQGGLNS